MATEITLGDLKPFLEFAKSGALGTNITNFDAFFDKIEETLKAANAWTDETAAQLAEARVHLEANPGLFKEGIDTFVKTVESVLTKYPLSTPISEIPELSGDGTGGPGGGDPVIVDGGHGIQIAVLEALRKDVMVDYDPLTHKISLDGAGVEITLPDVERIKFSDGTLAFDFDGIAGQVYRVYQAAFDRTPDGGGLKFWIDTRDTQGFDQLETAARFVDSKEFRDIYGTEPTPLELISKLYENILGREGEKAGIDFWVGEVEKGMAIARVLVGFSESNENVEGVAPAISDGIFY